MKDENKLFAEFKSSTYEEWYAEAVKLLKGAPFDKKMYTKTPEGITLKPIYNKEDVDFEIPLPGSGNYVRGTKVDGNKTAPWKISQEIAASTPEEFNSKILDALNKGQTSVEIVLDCPSSCGKDADEAVCERIGKCGLSVSTAKDFERALKGVETNCIDILGIQVPHFIIPVRPGRDMARLVEVAAMVHALRLMGHDGAKAFNERLIAHMKSEMEK